MPTVTRLVLRSGDRVALDGVVDSIRALVRRKGAELKGPHAEAPDEYRLAQYARLDGDPDHQFDSWTYTVYTRRLEFVGHDDLAATLLGRDFPDSVHVEAELDQRPTVGGR